MPYFAGIDWAEREHALCVVDDGGKVALQRPVEHSARGLRELVSDLAKLGSPAAVPIAIERPDGVLVDTLVAAGHPVYPVHPNALKACRPRYSAACGKCDRSDAYILADVMRTDGHRLRVLMPHSDEVRALRALVRARDDLVSERVAVCNQLRALLLGFWPGAVGLFADLASGISLAFLKRYPTPEDTRGLGLGRMAAFLKRNSYSGRTKPEVLVAHIRDAAQPYGGAIEATAKGKLVEVYVRVIETIQAQIKTLDAHVREAIAALPAGRVMMSFPHAGSINAAQIIAEIGGTPERYKNAKCLAAEGGVSPVTSQSGTNPKGRQKRAAYFRTACNKRLRKGLTCWADNSRRSSPWAAAKYARARARGCPHAHAVRILARAWCLVLWRCLVDDENYDPDQHAAAVRELAPVS
jgi:transposase